MQAVGHRGRTYSLPDKVQCSLVEYIEAAGLTEADNRNANPGNRIDDHHDDPFPSALPRSSRIILEPSRLASEVQSILAHTVRTDIFGLERSRAHSLRHSAGSDSGPLGYRDIICCGRP